MPEGKETNCSEIWAAGLHNPENDYQLCAKSPVNIAGANLPVGDESDQVTP
jgi:hypothetical protein